MKKVKLIRQTTTAECGLCCVSMLATWHGFQQPLSFYRSQFNVGRDGIDIKELYLILEKINLKPTAFNVHSLEEFQFESKPYILLTRENHFLVLMKGARGKFVTFNPSEGKQTISILELDALSSGLLLTASPSENFEIEKAKVNDFRHINKFFYTVIPLFSIVLLSSVFAYVLSIYIPRLLESIINAFASNMALNLTSILTQLFIVVMLYFFIFHIKNTHLVKLQKKLNSNISTYTFRHLLNLPYSYFDDRGEGNVLFRLGLLSQIQDVISNSFIQVIINLVSIVVISGFIVYRYFFLAPVILSLIIVMGIFLFISNKHILAMRQEEIASRARLSEVQTEIITTIFQIKSSRLENFFNGYFLNTFQYHNNLNAKTQSKINFLNLLVATFSTFIPILVIVYAVYSGGQVRVTVGEVFFLYATLGMFISYSTSFFSELFSIYMIRPSLLYLNDLYDEKEFLKNGDIVITEFETLKVKNLSFQYNDSSGAILKDINLEINRGEKVSVVGVSGSGKSTLIKLLSGLYPHDKGHIFVNNHNIKMISEDFFARQVSVVPQYATVFNKSVRENITLGNDNISDREIWDALTTVNMADVIKRLPMGLNTKINNKGSNFSGGQGQRLAIARSIVKKPTLLILDEATSSLDTWNESIIYNNLKDLGIALLTISHRFSTVVDSDRVYVLEEGTIIESGQHSELIHKEGTYNSLFKEHINNKKLKVEMN